MTADYGRAQEESTSSARAGSMPGFAVAAAMLVPPTRWGLRHIEAVLGEVKQSLDEVGVNRPKLKVIDAWSVSGSTMA